MNKIQQAFDEIKAEEALKANTLHAVLRRKKRRHIPQIAAACIVLLLIGGALPVYHTYATEAAYIEIGAQTPLGFSVNSYNKIIGVSDTQYQQYKGRNYHDVMDEILGTMQDGADIYIVSDSRQMKREVSGSIHHHCSDADITYGDMQMRQEAEHHGMTLGKYDMITEILKYNTDKTYADYAEYDMETLQKQYEALYESNPQTESAPGSRQHHKEKHGRGHHEE